MRIAWILLAEGLGVDASGALTAIGLNRNVLLASALPTTTKRAVVTRVEDIDLPNGTTIQASYSVVSPSGQVLMAQSASLVAGGVRFRDVPGALDLPGEFALTPTEYGPHVVRIELRTDQEEPLTAQVLLYVIEPRQVVNEGDQ